MRQGLHSARDGRHADTRRRRNPGAVGTVWRADETRQVTHDGRPLYIYSQEQPLAGSACLVTTGTGGNGNGVCVFGGTFSLIAP
jgi:hypothetical protein